MLLIKDSSKCYLIALILTSEFCVNKMYIKYYHADLKM